jgi:hypothetical protein
MKAAGKACESPSRVSDLAATYHHLIDTVQYLLCWTGAHAGTAQNASHYSEVLWRLELQFNSTQRAQFKCLLIKIPPRVIRF